MPEHSPPPHPFRFALVGAGKVGTTVALVLKEAGNEPVGVASRARTSAEEAARRFEVPVFEAESPPPADAYLIGVPDGAIEGMVSTLAATVPPGAVLIHFAGSLGATAVARYAARARVAALHPVHAFADKTSGRRLAGAAWGVTCEADIRDWCVGVIERDLGGRAVLVAEDDRRLWHVASVMTSNVVAAVMTAGAGVLERIGVDDPAGVLAPLARGTIENVVAAGARAEAITGPVVRREAEAIARHVAALDERAPDLRSIYVAATRTIVAVARSWGRINQEDERALLKELGAA